MSAIPFAKPPHPVPTEANLARFMISTLDAEIEKLNTLLKVCPIPALNYENSRMDDGPFGVSRDWVINTIEYWKGGYDWRKWEATLNSIPQFKITVKDDDSKTYDIHFMAILSEKRNAVPILFLHGWPGSVVEFLPMLLNLSSQYSSDPASLPYHVIVPSLIGFGWSSPPPTNKDFTCIDNARLLSKMMAALGFNASGYVVQGGDLGAFIAPTIASLDPACKLVHVNMFAMPPPEGVDVEGDITAGRYTANETLSLQRGAEFWKKGSGYATIQATRPSTMGFIVGASPVALLSWIGEKMIEWSDQTPSLDLVLTNISLWWFSGCYPTSIWHYRQLLKETSSGWENVDVPMGYSVFKGEIFNPPKAWIDSTGKVKWYRKHGKGGHFAALEEPEVFWKDVEDFVKEFWPNLVQ